MENLDLSECDALVFLDVGGMIDATLDVAQLKCTDSLRYLRISTEVTNAPALGRFRQLQTLNMAWRQIGDVPALSQLTQLRTLDISCCGMKDISFVRNLRYLEVLTLPMNPVKDLSPVGQLGKLLFVGLFEGEDDLLLFLQFAFGIRPTIGELENGAGVLLLFFGGVLAGQEKRHAQPETESRQNH